LLFIRYLGKQDQIWANIFCIPKNMHSRTLMTADKKFDCDHIYKIYSEQKSLQNVIRILLKELFCATRK